MPHYNEGCVLNTAWSGLQLEFPSTSTRTLSHWSEKTTLATVRSRNTSTQSYTVRPIISMSGKIVSLIYPYLRGNNGRMSENIRANLPHLKNVVVTYSASGKLFTSLVEYLHDRCLIFSLYSHKTLHISDSWSVQTDWKGMHKSIKELKRLEIPWKTNSKIQYSHVFVNRQ